MSGDLILGAYFAGKRHPQHAFSVPAGSIDYFADWYFSCRRLGLDVVLFHDHLKDTFTDKYTAKYADGQPKGRTGAIRFQEVELGRFTAGDERFFRCLEFLKHTPCDNVFIIDVSDAWIKKNPFDLIRKPGLCRYFDAGALARVKSGRQLAAFWRNQRRVWKQRRGYTLFMGGEKPGVTISQNPWMLRHYDRVYGTRFPELDDKPVLNCGIIGGTRERVIRLLAMMRAEVERLGKTDVLNDMAVFNRVIYGDEEFSGATYSNGVLNSPWKQYLKSGPYHIFHK